jgi:hypothetical protein
VKKQDDPYRSVTRENEKHQTIPMMNKKFTHPPEHAISKTVTMKIMNEL